MAALVRTSWLLAVLLALAGCSDGEADGDADGDVDGDVDGDADTGSDADGDADSGSGSEEDVQLCTDLVNQHRTSEGLESLARSAALEACAAAGAAEDAAADAARTHFTRTDGCDGAADAALVAHAAIGGGGPTTSAGVIRAMIGMMAEDGEPTLVEDHAEIGCGVHVTSGSVLWLAIYLR